MKPSMFQLRSKKDQEPITSSLHLIVLERRVLRLIREDLLMILRGLVSLVESIDAAIAAEQARHVNVGNDARRSRPVRGQDV
ncbi:hypothetical protein Tco_0981970, partial [Tanacetum coccineum]